MCSFQQATLVNTRAIQQTLRINPRHMQKLRELILVI